MSRSAYRSVVLAGSASGLIVAALVILGSFETLDLGLYDILFEWRGPRPARTPIVIVAIDEASIREIGQWPLPRSTYARVIARVSAGEPLAIGVDLLFDMPSARGGDDDAALGDAVKRAGNVVLAAAPLIEELGFGQLLDLHIPIREIRRGARHVAHVSNAPDRDGRLRQGRIVSPPEYHALPAFGVAVHDVARAAGMSVARIPDTSNVRANFRGGPQTFPWIPLHRVLGGEVSADMFRSKIVLIGATSHLIHDEVATPFARGGNMPGVEFLANVIATLVQGNRIREIPPSASALVALALGVAMGILVARRPHLALLAALLAPIVILGVTWIVFASLDAWFRPVAPLVVLPLSALFSLVAVRSFSRDA